jgi:8-oxo-dGTP pyrophosphatase MutT (NUDIX family)
MVKWRQLMPRCANELEIGFVGHTRIAFERNLWKATFAGKTKNRTNRREPKFMPRHMNEKFMPRHMNELARRIVAVEGVQTAVNRPPKDAAALVIVDRSCNPPAVLLGRRHKSHVFLPGKFVFPGGRMEKSDHSIHVCAPLDADAEAKLKKQISRPRNTIASALAVAAIRETFEETGLMVGTRVAQVPRFSKSPWNEFGKLGFCPDLSVLRFIARAITPPRYPRRFDTRFFAADASVIVHRMDNIIHSAAELTELVWLPIFEAVQVDMPVVTGLVLGDLAARIAAGYGHDLPVPFYRMRYKQFVRDLL